MAQKPQQRVQKYYKKYATCLQILHTYQYNGYLFLHKFQALIHVQDLSIYNFLSPSVNIRLPLMRTGHSPRVKKIGPSKITSPDRTVISSPSEKQMNIKATSSTTLQAPSSKKIIGQSLVTKTTTNIKNQPQLVSYNQSPIQKNQRIDRFFIPELNLFYDGEMLNGKFSGYGTLYTKGPEGYIYKGNWFYGSREGYGTYRYEDGSEYHGQWKENQKHGKGVYKNNQGEQYNGEWKHNKRDGEGKLSLSGGVLLEGQWRDDKFIKGMVRYSNYDQYKGAMKDYERQGYGQYQFANKRQKYKGNYSDNQKQRNGVYTFNDGDIYEGTFHNNRKQGINCRYVWNNSKYQLINAQFIGDRAIHGTIYDKESRKNVKTF